MIVNYKNAYEELKRLYERLEKENARLKDKIEKATNFVDKYMDEWDFQDEVWKDMNDLLILLKENQAIIKNIKMNYKIII